MNASETLKAAAAKLRNTAEKADPGPWRPGFEGAVWGRTTALVCEGFDADDAQWIAMMHPGLAEPLAVWLIWAASQASMNEDRAPRHRVNISDALDVARVILGEAAS